LPEGSAIVAVILINAAIGFFTELRADRSMEGLRRLGSVNTRVRRDGQAAEVLADNLVPGDFVLVEGGDVVTAVIRMIETSKLQADESALTGIIGLIGFLKGRELFITLETSIALAVAGIPEGMVIFDNIRKFLVYSISCNVTEIASVALDSAANVPLPLLHLQILYLNLATYRFSNSMFWR